MKKDEKKSDVNLRQIVKMFEQIVITLNMIGPMMENLDRRIRKLEYKEVL